MIHSKQILSITNAAVDALSSTRDVYGDKRAELRGGSLQTKSSTSNNNEEVTGSSRHQTCLNRDSSCSAADDRVSQNTTGETKDTSSSSVLELSFNGTQRVKVPSRLLREIKSPLERSSSSSESKEIPCVSKPVDEQTRPTPVKVIRHVNGPSAWIPLSVDDPLSVVKPPELVKTHGEPSRDDPTSDTTWHRSEERNLAGKQVSEVKVWHVADEAHGQDTYERRKNIHVKGLYQGQPSSGAPVFDSGKENACDVKVKRFVLSDKERALKEQFLKRQEQKKPTKKLVQPTLVSPQTDDRKDTQDAISKDNPVATAAAIAAAAASAATGPFLQLQHSLEAQIAALVSNLQALQQNHSRQQEAQDKEKESELQRQMEERLQRLEELQAKMLQTQSIQSAPVSNPYGSQNPSTITHLPNPLNPAVMLPSDHVTAAAVNPAVMLPSGHVTTAAVNPAVTLPSGHVPGAVHPPGSVVSYQNAPEMAWRDDRTQAQYAVAGHYQPHTTRESRHDPKDLHTFPGSRPAFEKHKVVRNTRTQTSPQEFVSSDESLLQTPLPRKRPPVPVSHYNLPRSRSSRPRSDLDRRVEKKARVRFDPDVSPTFPTYMNEMTDKGRGLVRELVTQDTTARGYKTGLETQKPLERTSVPPVSSEAATLTNEVGKLKTDLRDILTETEKLKQDLIHQKLLKDDAPSHSSTGPSFRPAGPSPLDEYLEATRTQDPSGHPSTSVTAGFLPTNSVRHFADAERILQDVQRRRENLDRNLEAVIRQREEQDLYNLVDNMVPSTGEFDEMLRIRREVDKKIGEITSAVQREINQEACLTSEQKQDSNLGKKQKSQPVKAVPPGARRVEQRLTTQASATGKKVVKKPTGKENLPDKPAAKKSKLAKTQAPPKRPATVTPAQKQVYLSSVYGQQPYHPQRTTSKAPYLHYQSPVNPKTAAIMAGLMTGERGVTSKPVLQDISSMPEKEVTEPRKKTAHVAKPLRSSQGQPTSHKDSAQYYFHPRVDLIAPEGGRVAAPLEGQLVPMAIPLGKPKTDPALRPPIATKDAKPTSSQLEAKADSPSPESIKSSDESVVQSPVPTPVRPSKPARPNVAVITVYDKELGESSAQQHKRHKKSPAKKKKSSLAVQVLPTVDIDSFSDSASSSPNMPHISDIPEPVSRPDDSEYQEFRNYLAVTETGPQERDEGQAPDDEDDDFHRIPTPQHPLTLEGFTGVEGQPYNGPPFPPVHPPVSVQHTGGVLEADTRREEALQERALEWIEQELLARIVSEMNQPVPDPTALTRPQATPESSTVSEPEDEDADVLAATIGLGGIQLFVDAGIPVDRDLVTNLIREVITENVSTILGHPKPVARPPSSRQSALEEEQPSRTPSPRGTPLPTPTPTPEYTPPESEESAHESTVVATPVRTPTPSVTSEEPTPSVSKEEEDVIEPIRDEEEKEEETGDQVSEVNTPVSTPVPTPPPVHSPPASISTPEPSVQEPEVSQDTVVPTPSPSIVVKTPTPEPEPEPEMSIAEEPSQPKEPSVSQKELTPPKPVQPSVSSPSSLSSTTLGTTATITTEEEISEGELIQPYVHTGKYSEGEFAISPNIVQLAVERKLPLGGDWDTTILGEDQDSRNELIRVAVNGILQRGEGESRSRDHGNRDSNSSVSDSPYQASSASTLRDTESIREDSVADRSDREPGEVRLRDPMAVLLSRIQNYRRSADNSASEGELLTEELRMPDGGQRRNEAREPGEIVSRKLSPGEVVIWEPSGAVRNPPPPFPGEFTLDDEPVDAQKNKIIAVDEVAPRTADRGPSHDDRSLHASDLLPGTLGTDKSFSISRQQQSKPKVIHVEERDSELSEESLQNTYSVEERRGEASALAVDDEEKEGEVPASERDRLDIEEERNQAVEFDEEIEVQQPTKIQVTLPSIDNNVHEESSVASDPHVSIDQDTFGDVSSISGGDF